MSKYHYRNISFSAYIEYDFLDCTGTFAENVLRICSHFMLIFLCPCCLCSRSLCTSLCGGEICTFLVHKVKRNRSIWEPCQFFYHQTPCENVTYLSVWKHERIYMEKIYGKVKNLYGTCEGFFKKNEKLYGQMMNLTEKVKGFIWQKIGKVKNLCGNTKDKKKWRISMEKWRIRLDKRKNLYGPTVF